MKTLSVLTVLSVFLLVSQTNACGGGGGGGGGRGRNSGSNPAPKQKVKKGTYGKIRDPDETKHRTGLGTLAKSLFKDPVKTVEAGKAMYDSYKEMRSKNIKGGNIKAHEKANKEATLIAGRKVAEALSAAREQYKNFRDKTNPDGSRHIGDTRTPEERKATMDANKRGREQALAELKSRAKKDGN